MIGKINPGDPRAAAFLDRCLYEYTGVWLKARAIRAIGAIADTRYKDLLEALARGDFGQVATGKPQPDQIDYLRGAAIDALGSIGDRRTLSLLQEQDWSHPDLQQAYYRASEEIAWRLLERDQAFASSPETTRPS